MKESCPPARVEELLAQGHKPTKSRRRGITYVYLQKRVQGRVSRVYLGREDRLPSEVARLLFRAHGRRKEEPIEITIREIRFPYGLTVFKFDPPARAKVYIRAAKVDA